MNKEKLEKMLPLWSLRRHYPVQVIWVDVPKYVLSAGFIGPAPRLHHDFITIYKKKQRRLNSEDLTNFQKFPDFVGVFDGRSIKAHDVLRFFDDHQALRTSQTVVYFLAHLG